MKKDGKLDRVFSAVDTEYFSTSDRILQLSDELSEEIVLENIIEQLTGDVEICSNQMNYITLYKEKYNAITPDDAWYDKDYLRESLTKLVEIVNGNFEKRYNIILGKDIDFCDLRDYLDDTEALYEFFFIRQFANLVSFFEFELKKQKHEISEKYCKILEDEANAKDIFVLQAKKKYKNDEDIAIIYFMNEIINDIRSSQDSAYDLFTEIAGIDPEEEFNAKILDLLANYGNGLSFTGNKEAYDLYMKPLDNTTIHNELKNIILMDFIKDCEVNE